MWALSEQSGLRNKFMKGNFIALFIIVISVLIPISSGQSDEDLQLDKQVITAQFATGFDLKRTCSNNGTYCSTAAVCNITIFYPNGGLLVSNSRMTNQFAFHNKTFTESELNQLGRHYASMQCRDPSGAINGNGMNNFDLDITADGKPYQNFPTQFYILGLGIFLILIGRVKDELSLMQNIGGIIMMVIGVLTIYPGYSFMNYSTLLGLSIGVSSIGLGFWFLIEKSLSHEKQVNRFDQDDDGRYED